MRGRNSPAEFSLNAADGAVLENHFVRDAGPNATIGAVERNPQVQKAARKQLMGKIIVRETADYIKSNKQKKHAGRAVAWFSKQDPAAFLPHPFSGCINFATASASERACSLA